MGTSWYFVHSEDDLIKTVLYCPGHCIRREMVEQGIWMANPENIIAYELEIKGKGGKKKLAFTCSEPEISWVVV